jgi:carbamoylphosphate synthase large subunit
MANIVMIGGARRVTLAEQMKALFESTGAALEIISVERDSSFYPISEVATVVEGPDFQDQTFSAFLEALANKHNALPVGCMDAALPHVSALRGRKVGQTLIVAHEPEAAQICLDKRLTHLFCVKEGIDSPKHFTVGEPIDLDFVSKPARGFGSKGVSFHRAADFKFVPDLGSDFVYQEKLCGLETTHDLYIDSAGGVTASSRDRFKVIDGEVDHCIVRCPSPDEQMVFDKIAATGLFWGPLTVQTFKTDDGQILLTEINARLGGGATASIAAGVPILEKYFEEAFGVTFPQRPIQRLELKRARRDFYKLLN